MNLITKNSANNKLDQETWLSWTQLEITLSPPLSNLLPVLCQHGALTSFMPAWCSHQFYASLGLWTILCQHGAVTVLMPALCCDQFYSSLVLWPVLFQSGVVDTTMNFYQLYLTPPRISANCLGQHHEFLPTVFDSTMYLRQLSRTSPKISANFFFDTTTNFCQLSWTPPRFSPTWPPWAE